MLVETTYLSGQPTKVTPPSNAHRPQTLTPISEQLAGEAGSHHAVTTKKKEKEESFPPPSGVLLVCVEAEKHPTFILPFFS